MLNVLATAMLPLIACAVVVSGLRRRLDLFSCFTEGAKKGMGSILQLIPTLVALMVGVEMLSIKKLSDNLTEIHANLYCERAAHKSIIIGKQGSMLQKIGSQARVDIERLLGGKVMLKLWVKVREGWRNREGDLRALGYEE